MSADKNRNERITDIVSGINEKFIEKVSEEREKDIVRLEAEKKKRKTRVIKLSLTAAACAAIVFAAKGALAGLFSAGSPNTDKGFTQSDKDKTATDHKNPSANNNESFTEYDKCKPIAALSYPEAPEFPSFHDSYYNNKDKYNEYRLKHDTWSNYNSRRIVNSRSLDISTDFYKNTAQEFLSQSDGNNRIYSPVNFYLALAMLAETTDGSSKAELLDLLGEDSIESLRQTANTLWLSHYRNDITTQTVLGNSIWLDKNLSYKKKTVKTLAESYYAECFKENLSDPTAKERIADWINTKTGGLLSDAAKRIVLPQDPKFMIYSTLYFKGKWEQEFWDKNNEQRIFHSPDGDITTEFMYNYKEYGPYYYGEDYGAVEHEFSCGGSMWFILPDEGKSIDDVLASGEYLKMIHDSEKYDPDNNWEKMKAMIVKLHLPKFDISSDLSLSDGLRKLGVSSVFEPGKADFSQITDDDVILGNVRHAARVTIDEQGCTAAAFTEEPLLGAARPPEEEIEFILDRPFIFVISSDVGEPLFIGTVYKP